MSTVKRDGPPMADEKKEEDTVGVPIEYRYPDGQVALYSNFALVQWGTHECHISFFEIKPPILMGTPDEVREQVKGVEKVTGNCVTRVIVAKDFMPALIAALQEINDKFGPKPASPKEK